MGSFLQKLLTNPEAFKFYTENQEYGVSPNNINPRTIPFGRDRVGGKDSNQPYIKKGLLNISGKDSSFYNDFTIRGGILAPLNAAEDVVRLSKYFTDIKNPKGLLFLAKENILSRIGTKTEASKGAGYAGGGLNEGAYTPLSTIGQALVGFAGGHLNKQGLDPTGLINALSINKYQDVIAQNQLERVEDNLYVNTNRLLLLSKPTEPDFLNQALSSATGILGISGTQYKPTEDILIQYGGGPNSILGFGKTKIKYATKNNGNKLTVFDSKNSSNLVNANGARYKTWDYSTITNVDYNGNGGRDEGSIRNIGYVTLPDFRKKILTNSNIKNFEFISFLSSSPNYIDKNIEDNLNLGNPGKRNRNRSSYTRGSDGGKALDKLNASYIYKSDVSKGIYSKDPIYSDIIPFIISILNNDNQEANDPGTYRKNMHFRAFIDSFSDSYDANWSSIEYMGRAEKLYKYKGFGRKISMAFTVVAQSREEITAMYDKLNFLASSLAPEYLDSLSSGYMAGNIAYITLGEYIHDQPGIINSLTFDIPEESPWEIGINDEGIIEDTEERRKDIRQLPHMIKVTGFNFTPIHKFRPEKQTFENDILGTDSIRLLGQGPQKYIDTTRPLYTNYDSKELAAYRSEAAAAAAAAAASAAELAAFQLSGTTITPGSNSPVSDAIVGNNGIQVQGLVANDNLVFP
jgi:hypothetical protein